MLVGNNKLKLDFYDECQRNAVYVYGALKVHKITHAVEQNKATLKFNCNSKSVNSFHNISSSTETSLIAG